MSLHDLDAWMWAEACAMIDRAERLQRQFFRPTLDPSKPSNWEPPVDIYETRSDVTIMIALPGVAPDQLQVILEEDLLHIVGHRHLPFGEQAEIRRLEIPYGRFERFIELPKGKLKIAKRELVNGCLVITLQKNKQGG